MFETVQKAQKPVQPIKKGFKVNGTVANGKDRNLPQPSGSKRKDLPKSVNKVSTFAKSFQNGEAAVKIGQEEEPNFIPANSLSALKGDFQDQPKQQPNNARIIDVGPSKVAMFAKNFDVGKSSVVKSADQLAQETAKETQELETPEQEEEAEDEEQEYDEEQEIEDDQEQVFEEQETNDAE